MPIYVSGVFQRRTGHQSNIVFSVASAQAVDVWVNLQALPIEVRESCLLLKISVSRAVKVDWRENFQRLRMGSFQDLSGREVTDSTVRIGSEEPYELDALGTALLPAAAFLLSGRLTLKDGTRCAVSMGTQDITVRCAGAAPEDHK